MALEEIVKIDKIEIVGLGHLQVRECTSITKDGNEIAKTYKRSVFAPGSDVSVLPQYVQDIAQAAWTSEIISNYQAHQE